MQIYTSNYLPTRELNLGSHPIKKIDRVTDKDYRFFTIDNRGPFRITISKKENRIPDNLLDSLDGKNVTVTVTAHSRGNHKVSSIHVNGRPAWSFSKGAIKLRAKRGMPPPSSPTGERYTGLARMKLVTKGARHLIFKVDESPERVDEVNKNRLSFHFQVRPKRIGDEYRKGMLFQATVLDGTVMGYSPIASDLPPEEVCFTQTTVSNNSDTLSEFLSKRFNSDDTNRASVSLEELETPYLPDQINKTPTALTVFELPKIWHNLSPKEILEKDIRDFTHKMIANSQQKLRFESIADKQVIAMQISEQDDQAIKQIACKANSDNVIQGLLAEKYVVDLFNAILSSMGIGWRMKFSDRLTSPGFGDGGSDLTINGRYFDVKSRKVTSTKSNFVGLTLDENYAWDRPGPKKYVVHTAVGPGKVYVFSYVQETEYQKYKKLQSGMHKPVMDVDKMRSVFDLVGLIRWLGVGQIESS